MHSKVIIASLVCLMTASFGEFHNSNVSKNALNKAETMSICRAPNDEIDYFTIEDSAVDSGDVIKAVFETEGSNYFTVLEKSPELSVSILFENGNRVAFIQSSSQSGEYYISFKVGTKKVGTVYIYSDGIHDCASSLSFDDARSIFFMEFIASFEEKMLLSEMLTPIIGPKSGLNKVASKNSFDVNKGGITLPDLNPTSVTKFDAQKHYTDFVYGNDDVTISSTFVPKTGSTSTSTKIKVHANWYDQNNNCHPLQNTKLELKIGDTFLATTVGVGSNPSYFTDLNGEFTLDINNNLAKAFKASLLSVTLYSSTFATAVEDNRHLEYPCCYNNSNISPLYKLSNFKTIDYYIDIYSGTSDRSCAYEISQAQLLPYKYCNRFTSGVAGVKTLYPAYYSAFANNGTPKITIQKEDYSTWDVLNHEYGHYICDSLNLCEEPAFRKKHNPLSSIQYLGGLTLNQRDQLIYSESLATYIALASQMFFASDSVIPGVGDETYYDPLRNVTIDCNVYQPDVLPNIADDGEYVEACVVSLLIKLLDDVHREGDDISWGDREMWEVILNTEESDVGNGRNIYCFLTTFLEYYLEGYPYINAEHALYDLLEKEHVGINYFYPYERDSWTIMIYMCGSDLESNQPYFGTNPQTEGQATADIQEILSAVGQPDDVNVIIETGGSYCWYNTNISSDNICRFHVRNGQLIQDCNPLPLANMGQRETFESFLDWGMTNYPAKRMGVILWDHGAALEGVCSDSRCLPINDGVDPFDWFQSLFLHHDMLTHSEFKQACNNVFNRHKRSKNLEFVGYDACLMQVQDVAEYNSHYFNYMIASEELEVGNTSSVLQTPYGTLLNSGWNYDEWLEVLYSDQHGDTTDVLDAIVDSYIFDVQGNANNTLSVLDLGEMDEYLSEFENLAYMFRTDLQGNNGAEYASSLESAIEESKRYNYYLEGEGYVYPSHPTFGFTVDAMDFLNNLTDYQCFSTELYLAQINTVQTVLEEMIIKNEKGTYAGDSNGLALYANFDNNGDRTNYPTSITKFKTWASIFNLGLIFN